MIYAFMGGRLGNQMFRYAAARAIYEKTKDKVYLDFERVTLGRKKEADYLNSLKEFNIHSDFVMINDKEPFCEPINNVCGFLKWYNKFIKKIGHEKNISFNITRLIKNIFANENMLLFDDYVNYPKRKGKNYYIYGCCESSKYFNDIREILLEEFTPKNEIREEFLDFYKLICDSNSVCISIRRWNPQRPELETIMGVTQKEYYKNGINILREKLDNPKFFVFSNDVEWAKDFLQDESFFYEPLDLLIPEKLKIMYSCKHFIIPNSTFAWWAQYLCRNQDKIVIAPKNWSKLKYRKNDLTEKNFITLKNF